MLKPAVGPLKRLGSFNTLSLFVNLGSGSANKLVKVYPEASRS